MLPLRYGHCDGHTDICYTDSSRNFVTCGGEGDVRVWEDINDTDQKDLCIGEKAWAICQKGKNLYVATDKNIVQAYTFPDLEVDGIITRFTAPVTQIDISLDEKKLAAGSCDMDIHIVDIDTMEKKVLSGHMAPILSISLDPQLLFLVSSSCDGTVKVWNVSSSDVVHQWDSFVEKSNSFERAPSLCRLHFQPIHGHYLAIPVKNNINIYARESWASVKTLAHSNNDSTFSVVRYSKCGKFIAGGTVKGHVCIFNVSQEKVINEISDKNAYSITAISWHSKSTGIIFCNVNGQIGELLISSSTPTEEPEAVKDLADIPLRVPDFDDDDDDENVFSLEKIKAESGFGQDRFTSSPIKTEDKDDKESLISDRFSKLEPKIPFAELQEPFQPSSTPTHLQERFLLWNSVGIVRGFNREDGVDELDIQFHDTTLHHGFRMSNMPGYSMAALTQQVLVLSSPRLGELPSKLYCVLLKAWDGQKEWEASLGTEEIIGVAAGRNWVAVATDRLLLRVYSVDGTQTDLISIPGPLASLIGFQDQLSVYFHSAQGRDRDQYISYMLININTCSKLGTVRTISPLPLTPTSTIKWVGYSDEGSPTALDSEGYLRLLYGKQWRPICSLEDRPKGKFDHYFVLGLSEKSHTIRSILCKGAYYPPVVPKPIVNEIDWQIPLSDLDTDRGKLEEEMLRAVITIPNLQLSQYEEDISDAKSSIEKTISVTVMKLFALACRTGLESRAVSLCESMPSVDVVKLACKYAAKLGRHQLANKVSEVAARMAEEENLRLLREREEDCQMDDDCDERMSSASSRHHLQEGSSQDIFADHNDTTYRQSSKLSDKENLIMKMRKKKLMADNPEPKPNILDGQKKFSRNPFKKSQPEDDDTSKESPSTPKMNYMEWFNQNKSAIRAEHPLLKDSELAMVGMKKYRQMNNTSKADTVTSAPSTPVTTNKDLDRESSRDEEIETKKRKLSDIMNESTKKKQLVAEKKTSTTDKNSPLTDKKPISAVSKLKNFSFVKKSQ